MEVVGKTKFNRTIIPHNFKIRFNNCTYTFANIHGNTVFVCTIIKVSIWFDDRNQLSFSSLFLVFKESFLTAAPPLRLFLMRLRQTVDFLRDTLLIHCSLC